MPRACWRPTTSGGFRRFELELEEPIDSAWADHAAIAAAILKNSPIQAGFLMDEHIAEDERMYRQKLDRATD